MLNGNYENSKSAKKCLTDPDWRNSKHSILEGISHLLETGLYTDFTFKVGPNQEKFKAHKIILMMRSNVFASKFSPPWSLTEQGEKEQHVLEIFDKTPESFNYFMKYLYTDEFAPTVPVKTAVEVLELADFYELPGLIQKCSQLLTLKIGVDSCVEIYQKTRLYSDIDLATSAYQFIIRNISQVASNDQFIQLEGPVLKPLLENDNLAIDEIHLFKALLRWGQTEGLCETESRKELVGSLFESIRFLLISPKDFAADVIGAKIFSNEKALEILRYLNGVREKTDFPEHWSRPRLGKPEENDEIKCFQTDVNCILNGQCPVVQLLKQPLLNSLTPALVPQFRFRSNSGVLIRGLKMYGLPVSPATKDNAYNVQFAITASDVPLTAFLQGQSVTQTNFCSVNKTISTALQNFDVLLESAFQTVANHTYWISAVLLLEGFSLSRDLRSMTHGVSRQENNILELIKSKCGSCMFEISHSEGSSLINSHCAGWNRSLSFSNAAPKPKGGIVHSILFTRIPFSPVSTNNAPFLFKKQR